MSAAIGRPIHPGDAAWGDYELSLQRRRQRIRSLQTYLVWAALVALILWVLLRFQLDLDFLRRRWWFIVSRGVPMTVGVSLLSITCASLIALVGAACRLSRNPVLSGVASFYTSLIRGTPLLVQVYVIYLGLPQLGIVLQALTSGILALSINYGAYMTEIFRAGILSIPHGQREAALALGMTPLQAFRRVIFPQAFRNVVPAVGNEFVAMLKDSSLVSVMGVWELTFVASKTGRGAFKNMEAMLVAAAAYWVLTALFSWVQGRVEARLGQAHER